MAAQSSPLVPAVIGGALMGLANLVPGISGGTMLLITGVYPGFIGAIAEVTTLRWRWPSVLLLGTIGAAAGLAILLLAGPTKTLVIAHRWIMYSLFIGLTLGSVPLLWRLSLPVSRRFFIGAGGTFGLMVLLACGDSAANRTGRRIPRAALSCRSGRGECDGAARAYPAGISSCCWVNMCPSSGA